MMGFRSDPSGSRTAGAPRQFSDAQARFTPSAVTKIGEALGTSPQFWLILEKSFRAWSERQRK
jgi:plasmid maintenance system antidote protein VapI